MTHTMIVAAAANSENTNGGAGPDLLCLDPDNLALFVEVDAILCAALDPARCPPAPPVTGCTSLRPRSTGRAWGALVRPRARPVHPVWAVQRSAPDPHNPRPR